MSLRQVKPGERLGLLYIAVNLFFLSVLLLVLDPGPVTALIVVVAIFLGLFVWRRTGLRLRARQRDGSDWT